MREHEMRILLLSIFALFTGCAQLAPVRDNIVIGVEKYCASLSYAQRVLLRSDANATLQRVCVVKPDGSQVCGASIKVHCPGDPE
jgi:hypothetical protein